MHGLQCKGTLHSSALSPDIPSCRVLFPDALVHSHFLAIMESTTLTRSLLFLHAKRVDMALSCKDTATVSHLQASLNCSDFEHLHECSRSGNAITVANLFECSSASQCESQ